MKDVEKMFFARLFEKAAAKEADRCRAAYRIIKVRHKLSLFGRKMILRFLSRKALLEKTPSTDKTEKGLEARKEILKQLSEDLELAIQSAETSLNSVLTDEKKKWMKQGIWQPKRTDPSPFQQIFNTDFLLYSNPRQNAVACEL